MLEDLAFVLHGDGIPQLLAFACWCLVGLVSAPFALRSARRARMTDPVLWVMGVLVAGPLAIPLFVVMRARHLAFVEQVRGTVGEDVLGPAWKPVDPAVRLRGRALMGTGAATLLVGVGLSSASGMSILFTGLIVGGLALILRGLVAGRGGAFREEGGR